MPKQHPPAARVAPPIPVLHGRRSRLAVAAPAVLTASKTDSRVVVGQGDYQYEVLHHWPQLPAQFRWQTTHNVAVDRAGQLYVIHEGDPNQPDHPSIFVFDAEREVRPVVRPAVSGGRPRHGSA